MIYRKLIVLVSLLIGFVNIAFAGVGDLDTLNVRSQAPVKERMPVVAYKFNPKSLILPASLITVGAVGTASTIIMRAFLNSRLSGTLWS